MKIKIHLFRLTVAAVAFLFGTGCFTAWRYFQSFTSTPEKEFAQADLSNISENYPTIAVEPAIELPKPPVPESASEANTETPEFDAEGYYYIAHETPKGFEEFVSFSVINKNYESEDEDKYGKLMAPKGSVQAEKEFKFSRISIGNGQIQFETERIRGISYSFTGRFIETRNFIHLEAGEVEKVLEGRLIKKRKGKTIVERDVKFGWFFEMGCSC
jgi:hypothetical protein